MFAKTLKILGYTLLYAAIALIFFGYASKLYFQGFSALRDLLNPYNITNYLAVVITLAPGLALIWVSGWLKTKSQNNEVEK